MIDASGSGDVKMKCKRYIDGENRIIETLTGRKVKIPSHWNPSDNTIRVGVKLASELFPKPLMQRLRNENRDNFWRPSIKRLMANLACDMDEAEEYISEITQNYKYMSNLSTDEDNLRETIQTNINKTLNDQENSRMEQKIETFSSQTKSNLSKQLKDKNSSKRHLDKSGLTPSAAKVQLKAAARSLEDSLFLLDQHYSPMEIVYDCFVFHNGNEWVACVDTSPYDPNKTLSDLPLLRDYTVNREYASFGEQTQLYYTVKVFDNGKLLQIVTNNSSHGTHVAAIAAAYFPNDVTSSSANASGTKSNYNTYDRNGVAPGAQIVSIKISDGRLGTMETGISLPRAIKWTVELKCDIVNYSFGEQVIWPNVGRISKYLNRMIHKYGIIMVASGGNNGPSLGSLSCPGGTVQGVIGVAPLVFPDMMRNLYCQPDDSSLHHQSLLEDSFNIDNETKCRNDRVDSVSRNVSTTSPTRKNAHPTNYNWGSRGPAFDGAFGLCVAAPGGANTSIASWQLKPTGLLSGSSMSAPMVTGGISLILSGLRHCYNCTNDNGLLKIPPSLIYLSLMNTSKRIEHLSYLDQGYGLMQIDTAFQYLNHILYTLYKRNDYRIIGNIENDTHVDSHDDVDNRAHSSCVDGGVSYDSLYNVQPSSSLNSRDSLCQSLGIPDPCMTYGWHIRLTVSGPGCTPQNRGIWLRRGWLLSPRAVTNTTSLPLLRYTLNMCIEFDEYVPINVRRSLELHLTTELLSEFNGLTNSNNWLQIASIITVTNTSRDIHFVIDPIRCSELLNALSKDDKMKVTTITQLLNEQNTPCNRQHLYESSLLQEGGLQPQLPPSSSSSSSSVIQQEQHRSQLSDFCWPSNLATPKVGHYGNNNNNNNNNSDNLPIKSQKPYVMMIGFRATDYPEMGILACLPIIVHIPHRLNRSRDLDQPHFLFSDRFDAKNKVRRWFIEVPYGATAGILRLARLDNDGDKCCEFTITINSSWIGMSSEKQEIRWSSIELNKCGQSKSGLKRNYKTLPAYNSDDFDCASQFAFPIQWETDYLELTIAQNWGLELPAIVVGELYFRGLEPSSRCIVLNTSDRYCRIGLRSNFANEAIQPDIWLTHWCLPVKPYDSKIFYLGHGTNELFVDEHSSYALRLMYQFTCPFKIVTAVICLPWLQDMLYSSDYLIHIFHVYDNRGRFIGAGNTMAVEKNVQNLLSICKKATTKLLHKFVMKLVHY
ncbi:unnamed protein product [Heterobilharzia americana]|nr:unnamed protein product [Heterobilharzia americana]